MVLTICVFLCIVSACVMPMFENALLGRMLVMKFNKNNQETGSYTNRLTYSLPIDMRDEKQSDRYYSDLIENDLVSKFGQEIAYFNKISVSDVFNIKDIEYQQDISAESVDIFFITINNYENNIKLSAGKYPSSTITSDGCIEVAINNDIAIMNDIEMNRNYLIYDQKMPDKKFMIKIVGIFDFYYGGVSLLSSLNLSNGIIMDISNFNNTLVSKFDALRTTNWDYFLIILQSILMISHR